MMRLLLRVSLVACVVAIAVAVFMTTRTAREPTRGQQVRPERDSDGDSSESIDRADGKEDRPPRIVPQRDAHGGAPDVAALRDVALASTPSQATFDALAQLARIDSEREFAIVRTLALMAEQPRWEVAGLDVLGAVTVEDNRIDATVVAALGNSATDEERYRAAVQAIANRRIAGEDVIAVLRTRLSDGEESIVRMTLDALEKLGTAATSAREAIRDLSERELTIRRQALRTYGAVGGSEAVTWLAELVTSHCVETRRGAVDGLRFNVAAVKARAALGTAMRDADPETRQCACEGCVDALAQGHVDVADGLAVALDGMWTNAARGTDEYARVDLLSVIEYARRRLRGTSSVTRMMAAMFASDACGAVVQAKVARAYGEITGELEAAAEAMVKAVGGAETREDQAEVLLVHAAFVEGPDAGGRRQSLERAYRAAPLALETASRVAREEPELRGLVEILEKAGSGD